MTDALVHVPIAVGVQLASWGIGRAMGVPTRAGLWLGAFAGGAVCVMREITQHEYRWIEAFGDGRRANMAGYEGLKVWDWNRHSIEETVLAVAAVAAVALVAGRGR
ncbi:hypothetical protein [Sphingomonas sanxanigenens]|uniref:Uncharacterized protein n=1 Tax=Sphingomonas sanxanigenens DSM 19645 = NX02 TaxID=1123269 RepID=W0ACK9_9SPHN|nr:hypothetical protein [Sphingomonas sanxanigenens]AHE53415.1 hypothetical protein NX02_08460 [Sphingomonas sanxanigenens DSM 19645 = NX02]